MTSAALLPALRGAPAVWHEPPGMLGTRGRCLYPSRGKDAQAGERVCACKPEKRCVSGTGPAKRALNIDCMTPPGWVPARLLHPYCLPGVFPAHVGRAIFFCWNHLSIRNLGVPNDFRRTAAGFAGGPCSVARAPRSCLARAVVASTRAEARTRRQASGCVLVNQKSAASAALDQQNVRLTLTWLALSCF